MFVKFHLPIDAVNATDEDGCGCPKIRNEHNAFSGHNSRIKENLKRSEKKRRLQRDMYLRIRSINPFHSGYR